MGLGVTEEVRGSGAERFPKIEKERVAFAVGKGDIRRVSDHICCEGSKMRHGCIYDNLVR